MLLIRRTTSHASPADLPAHASTAGFFSPACATTAMLRAAAADRASGPRTRVENRCGTHQAWQRRGGGARCHVRFGPCGRGSALSCAGPATSATIHRTIHGDAEGGPQANECKGQHAERRRGLGVEVGCVRDNDLNIGLGPEPCSGERLDIAVGLGGIGARRGRCRHHHAGRTRWTRSQAPRLAGRAHGRCGRHHVGQGECHAGQLSGQRQLGARVFSCPGWDERGVAKERCLGCLSTRRGLARRAATAPR